MTSTTHGDLDKRIKEAEKQVVIGGVYRHYKHPERKYFVERVAIQEATLKPCVLYKDIATLSAPSFVRDLDSWLENVEWEGKMVPRFVLTPTSINT